MSIVKKWASCVVSFVASVLALALSACTGMVVNVTTPLGKSETVTKAFKVITDSKLLDQAELYGAKNKFLIMKVFSIVLLVVAVLLFAYSVVMLLKNLDVIKAESKIFAIAGLVLAVLFLVATIGVFASSLSYASAVEAAIPSVILKQYGGAVAATMIKAVAKIGVYQPIMLATGIVTAGVVTVFEVKNVKKS